MSSTDIRNLWYNSSCQDTYTLCYYVNRTLGTAIACPGRPAQQLYRGCLFLFKGLPTMRYNTTRSNAHLSKWYAVIDTYGDMCAYCHDQPATQIDHVIPVSWRECNHLYNLRPACSWCNLLANSLVFSSFDEKYDWVRKERNRRKWNKHSRTVCTCCKLPYQNPLHAPSFFMCAECYDYEYGKMTRKRKQWSEWLNLCGNAGFIIPAHRALAEIVRKNPGTTIPHKDKARILAEEYAKRETWEIVGAAEYFRQMETAS